MGCIERVSIGANHLRSFYLHPSPIISHLSSLFSLPHFSLSLFASLLSPRYTVAIDLLAFDFKVFSPEEEAALTAPEDGAYVRGLFVEGATWDTAEGYVIESRPRELYANMPVIWLLVRTTEDLKEEGERHLYQCPVYKTSERRGMLSTTGHSTNFVLFIGIPMEANDTQKHWIKRGVAMLTQLDT